MQIVQNSKTIKDEIKDMKILPTPASYCSDVLICIVFMLSLVMKHCSVSDFRTLCLCLMSSEVWVWCSARAVLFVLHIVDIVRQIGILKFLSSPAVIHCMCFFVQKI